jgi:hypothetical protein
MPCALSSGVYGQNRFVAEDADESLYWLGILVETELMTEAKLKNLIQEADELTAIFTAAAHTARQNRDR